MELTVDEDGVLHGPFLRSAYNYDMHLASLQSGLLCEDATRTQQQFQEECDINTIVERFGLTGQLPNDLRVPLTGDFDDIIDYQTALNRIMEADTAFMQMPAAIRGQFENDPGRFVDFVSDPKNLAQCKEWGLAAPQEPRQAPIEVRVIPDPSEPTKTA